MPYPQVAYETYAALRDHDISHRDVDGGRWQLGHVASWARWGLPGDLVGPITASSREDFAGLAPLTTSIVLFGINWGGESPPVDPPLWQNFHTPGHTGDGALRNSVRDAYAAVLGEDAPAAYMSDVFKLIPTPNASELTRTIRRELAADRHHVSRCATLLEWELGMCRDGAQGVPLVIVGMGAAAFNWLSGRVKDQRIAMAVDAALGTGAHQRVRRMPHYSFGSATREQRTSALADILRNALDPA